MPRGSTRRKRGTGMQFDKYTIKAQEALQEAQKLAAASRHAEVTPLHLLLALTRQDEGIVVPILQRLGADPRARGRRHRGAARLDGAGPGRRRGAASPRPGSRFSNRPRRSPRNSRTIISRPNTCCWRMAREPGEAAEVLRTSRRHTRRHPCRPARGARRRAGHRPESGRQVPGPAALRPRPDGDGPPGTSSTR